MVLKFSFLPFIWISLLYAAPLPELATKQDVTNIRYITRDGRFTYYQRRSGDLLLSTNFNVKEVLKAQMGTNYNIVGKEKSKWLLVRQIIHYHQSLDPRLTGKIYRLERGKSDVSELGEGIAPRLHSDGSWGSFFSPHSRVLTLKNLDNPQIGFNIQTPVKLNPYFVPDVAMLDEQTVFYTDMNENGESALIHFDRTKEKSKVIFKPNGINRRLEICHGFGKTYLGAFPYQQFGGASEIWEIDKEKGPSKPIYTSNYPDIGHMVCDHTEGTIYFSKGFKLGESIRHDIYSLNIKSGETTAVSDLRYATQLINLDGLLLIPFQGKYLVPLDQKQGTESQKLNSDKEKEASL